MLVDGGEMHANYGSVVSLTLYPTARRLNAFIMVGYPQIVKRKQSTYSPPQKSLMLTLECIPKATRPFIITVHAW
jgi:hypothetical protein